MCQCDMYVRVNRRPAVERSIHALVTVPHSPNKTNTKKRARFFLPVDGKCAWVLLLGGGHPVEVHERGHQALRGAARGAVLFLFLFLCVWGGGFGGCWW